MDALARRSLVLPNFSFLIFLQHKFKCLHCSILYYFVCILFNRSTRKHLSCETIIAHTFVRLFAGIVLLSPLKYAVHFALGRRIASFYTFAMNLLVFIQCHSDLINLPLTNGCFLLQILLLAHLSTVSLDFQLPLNMHLSCCRFHVYYYLVYRRYSHHRNVGKKRWKMKNKRTRKRWKCESKDMN